MIDLDLLCYPPFAFSLLSFCLSIASLLLSAHKDNGK